MISLSLTAYQLGTMNLYGALIKELRKDNSVNFINSLLFFGIPGLLMNLGVYYLIPIRSEEHTSELQSRGLIPYAGFCLKKKKKKQNNKKKKQTNKKKKNRTIKDETTRA